MILASEILLPPEISAAGHSPLYFQDKSTIWWEEASEIGADSYNLHRGDLNGLAAGNYGSCLATGLPLFPSTAVPDNPPTPGQCWIYLISGVNVAGEGILGFTSSDVLRAAGASCP